MMIIGRPKDQTPGIYHCVARAMVDGVPYYIDPDEPRSYVVATEESLQRYLETVDGIYIVVKSKRMSNKLCTHMYFYVSIFVLLYFRQLSQIVPFAF
jgi:hypothetical protein